MPAVDFVAIEYRNNSFFSESVSDVQFSHSSLPVISATVLAISFILLGFRPNAFNHPSNFLT